MFVGLALLEAVLWALETAADQPLPQFVATSPAAVPLAPELPPEIRLKIERMQSALIMPPSWQKRDLEKANGIYAYVWQTALHVNDANQMRRREPFPPRDPNRFRIMVVGDSFTYGDGIDAFWTYPEQLERSLARDFRVEVLNLGVDGYASEDVLNVVRRFLPELKPDLVVYGVCLNDFLESGTYQTEPYPFPLPDRLKKKLLKRSRVARQVEEWYGALLRIVGLRPDFYSELLADFDTRRRRFGRDVAALDSFVTERGLPPMVAMVLDQSPRLDGPGRKLAVAAEERLRAAGIDTVDSGAFYRRFNGRNFGVSCWEAHPNEEAHAIWASILAQRDSRARCARPLPAIRRCADGGTKLMGFIESAPLSRLGHDRNLSLHEGAKALEHPAVPSHRFGHDIRTMDLDLEAGLDRYGPDLGVGAGLGEPGDQPLDRALR